MKRLHIFFEDGTNPSKDERDAVFEVRKIRGAGDVIAFRPELPKVITGLQIYIIDGDGKSVFPVTLYSSRGNKTTFISPYTYIDRSNKGLETEVKRTKSKRK